MKNNNSRTIESANIGVILSNEEMNSIKGGGRGRSGGNSHNGGNGNPPTGNPPTSVKKGR